MTHWMFQHSKYLLRLFLLSLIAACGIFYSSLSPDVRTELSVFDYLFSGLCSIAVSCLYLILLADTIHGKAKNMGPLGKSFIMFLPTIGILFVYYVVTRSIGIV